MDQTIIEKLLAVQDAAKEDGHYQKLLEEYQVLARRLLAAMEEMEPNHREAVMDYLGLVHAISLQTVVLALSLNEKC